MLQTRAALVRLHGALHFKKVFPMITLYYPKLYKACYSPSFRSLAGFSFLNHLNFRSFIISRNNVFFHNNIVIFIKKHIKFCIHIIGTADF